MRFITGLTMTLVLFLGASLPQAFAHETSSGAVGVKGGDSGEFAGQAGWKEHAKSGKRVNGKKVNGSNGRGLRKVVSKLTKEQIAAAYDVMCREAKEAGRRCQWVPPKKKGKPSSPTRIAPDLSAIARTLLTRIQLPDPTPQFGPDPSVNEWKMVAVGYPLWLWTAGPGTVTDRVRAYGVTFTLRATWTSSRFDMGDGHSVSCRETKAYSKSVKPGTASPVCGYTYATSSLPKGSYTVRATTNWRVSWSALGVSGTLPASFTGTRSLPVGELDALVVK